MTYVCSEYLHVEGELHEPFCLKERCPFRNDQLASCPCIFEVLKLRPEKTRVVDEYIDDSIEPLRGLNERWEIAL